MMLETPSHRWPQTSIEDKDLKNFVEEEEEDKTVGEYVSLAQVV